MYESSSYTRYRAARKRRTRMRARRRRERRMLYMGALALQIVLILALIASFSVTACIVLACIYTLAGYWGYAYTIRATGADRE